MNRKANSSAIWIIRALSPNGMTDYDREYIAGFVNEEELRAREPYNFTLHYTIESKKYSDLFVEGTKTAVTNLCSKMTRIIPHTIYFRKYEFHMFTAFREGK